MSLICPTVVRIIPCLDVDKGRVVKGTNFLQLRDAGDPLELAEFYSQQGADELVFLDITASSDRRDIILDLVDRTAAQIHIPFTVGGGVRSLEDARRLLHAGADKVALNTAAVENPQLIGEISGEFGAQCTVVAIDARRNPAANQSQSGHSESSEFPVGDFPAGDFPAGDFQTDFTVFTHGGRTPANLDAVLWAKEAEERGAGEILLTSMDKDGTKDGYDLPLTRAVSTSVNVPVIASGGAGELPHLVNAVKDGAADAVLVASIFHYGQFSIAQAKAHMAEAGIRVRPLASN